MARNCKCGQAASIINGSLYFEDVKQADIDTPEFQEILEEKTLKAVRLVSLENQWRERDWLSYELQVDTFLNFEMTLRREKRGQLNHWYAYRRFAGQLHKRYVGTSDMVTTATLVKVAQKMPGFSKGEITEV